MRTLVDISADTPAWVEADPYHDTLGHVRPKAQYTRWQKDTLTGTLAEVEAKALGETSGDV